METEQLIAYLRAAAQIRQADYFNEITEGNLAFLGKLSMEMNKGIVSESTIERLLDFLKKNEELIMTDLPEHIIEQEKIIRQNMLKILARALNLSVR